MKRPAPSPPPDPATSSPRLQGLTDAEAERRLAADGPNRLAPERRRRLFEVARDVLREPMFLLLLVAVAVYFALGDHAEAAFLFAGALATIGLVIVQEARSERALAALKALAEPAAQVVRSGRTRRIPAASLVRGDEVLLAEGGRARGRRAGGGRRPLAGRVGPHRGIRAGAADAAGGRRDRRAGRLAHLGRRAAGPGARRPAGDGHGRRDPPRPDRRGAGPGAGAADAAAARDPAPGGGVRSRRLRPGRAGLPRARPAARELDRRRPGGPHAGHRPDPRGIPHGAGGVPGPRRLAARAGAGPGPAHRGDRSAGRHQHPLRRQDRHADPQPHAPRRAVAA